MTSKSETNAAAPAAERPKAVRMEVNSADHRRLRVAAARLGQSMTAFVYGAMMAAIEGVESTTV